MFHTRIEQTQWELWLPKAPVEAVDELVQVLLQVFSRDSVISAQQIGLEIADGDVHPGQPFIYQLGWRHTAFMLLCFSQNPQGYEAIRAGRLLREQMAFHELADIFTGHRRGRLHGDKTRLFTTTFDGHQDRSLSLRAPTTLASRPSSADERIVDLYQTTQAIDTVPVGHGVAHLAQHAVCGDPGNSDLLGQAQGRYPALIAGHQIDGQKPLHQRQIGRVKERAGGHRGLITEV